MPCSALVAYQAGETYASGPVTTASAGVSGSIAFQCWLAFAMCITRRLPAGSQITGSIEASG